MINFGPVVSSFITDFRNQVCVIGGPTGTGKCLARGTNVIRLDGTLVSVEDVKVGDKLLGPDSKPRIVKSIFSGSEKMYLVKQKGNDDYVVNESHILSLKVTGLGTRHGRGTPKKIRGRLPGEIINIPIKDYVKESATFKHSTKGWKPSGGVDYDNSYQDFNFSIPAYLFGVWLGDGTSCRFEVTTADREILDAFSEFVLSEGYYIRAYCSDDQGLATQYKGTEAPAGNSCGRPNKLISYLKELGVFENKHIPDCYLLSNRESRLELLAGLLDSDGSLDKRNRRVFEYVSVSKVLATQVRRLALSLGLRVPGLKEKLIDGKVYYRMSITGAIQEIPTRLERKRATEGSPNKSGDSWGIEVTEIGVDDYYGFSLDGDHLFMLEDFTVSHNSFSLFQKLLVAASIQRAHRGVRRTHFLLVRPSAGDVRESIIKDLEDEILTPIKDAGGVVEFVGQYPIKGTVKFGLPDGTEVHCELTGMGLEDRESAKRKLRSKKYTCAIVPEMQTLWEKGILDEIVNRIDRYPTDKDGGIAWELPMSDGSLQTFRGGRMWGDMNYTDKRHWFYDYMVVDNIIKENGLPTRKFYELPSILTPVPDPNSSFTYRGEPVRFEGNPQALPYIKHAVQRDEEGEKIPNSEFEHWLNQIDQMPGDDAQIDEVIMGVWGFRTDGKPVYPGFSMTEHVSGHLLSPNVSKPVYVGVDGGFNNSFVFGQEGLNGRLQVFDEINNVEDEAKSLSEALEMDVLPLLNSRYYGCDVNFILDPSMFYGDGGKGNNQAHEFYNRGLRASPAPIQDPNMRFKDSNWFIITRGVLEISNNCTELVSALAGGYNHRMMKNGMFGEHPDKNSRYSHIGDAFQYLCCQFKRGFARPKKRSGKRKTLHRW